MLISRAKYRSTLEIKVLPIKPSFSETHIRELLMIVLTPLAITRLNADTPLLTAAENTLKTSSQMYFDNNRFQGYTYSWKCRNKKIGTISNLWRVTGELDP